MSEGAQALIQLPCGGGSGGSSSGTVSGEVCMQLDVSGLVAARIGLMDEMVRAQQRRAQRQQQQQQQESAGEHSQVSRQDVAWNSNKPLEIRQLTTHDAVSPCGYM